MRRVLSFVLLVAVMLGAAWMVLGGAPPAVEQAGVGRQGTTQVERREAVAGSGSDAAGRRARSLAERSAEREAMHRRILAALEQRGPAPVEPGGVVKEEASGGQAVRKPGEAEATAPGSMMKDRTGNHAYLTRVLSEDLIPLADECYEMASERAPGLAGMLVLEVSMVGDEEIGGVIDRVEPGTNNEIVDPGLLECVRESLLATTLPAPEHGGRDAIALSMRFAPDAK